VEFLLLVLLGLAIPFCAIGGFAIAVQQRRRVDVLEQRLAQLEADLGRPSFVPAAVREPIVPPWVQAARDAAAPPPGATAPVPEPVSQPSEPAAEPFGQPPSPPPLVPSIPEPAAPRPGLEETLGTQWAVWVGGLALALGGLFLVRYSIEQGFFGPAARVAAGAFFALALVAGGEWLRRRAPAGEGTEAGFVPIPAMVTAAGTSTAFATAYAAYALYDMLPPAAAFLLLGAISLVTLFASALHGPALAALGLVAALGSPLLVSSAKPQLWPLVLYLGFVVLSAYAVARLRLWRWLAVAGAAGALLWAVVMIFSFGADHALARHVHVGLQALLVAVFLVADPHRRTRDGEATLDPLASLVLAGFAAIAALAATDDWTGQPLAAGLMVVLLLGLGLRFPAVAPAAGWSAALSLAVLAVWPVAREALAEPLTIIPDDLNPMQRPQAVTTFLTVAAGFGLLAFAANLWRAVQGRALPLPLAAWHVGAAVLAPLAILTLSYLRVAQFDRSLPFALVAGALGLAFSAAAGQLRRRDIDGLDGVRLATGATAAGAVAALALGLTFALDKGMLTVAFALSALGTAWVAERSGLPILRSVVGALGLIVAARLAYDPTIVGGDPGRTPILNWLLWGYGVPAACFLAAARLLERSGRDRVVRFVESLGLAFAAFFVTFEIRHALQGGDPFAETSSHLEMGLLATAGLVFSLVMVRSDAAKPDPVYKTASLIFGLLGLLVAGFGLALAQNPLLTGEPILGGAIFNSLIPAYLLPALVAAALALVARRTRPPVFVQAAALLAGALQFLYTVLAIRRVFQGPLVDLDLVTGQGEQWAYSLALLAIGILLLAIGLVWNLRRARLISAAYILLAVAKVFLVDLASLEGVMRALSFIGLGLVLMGIGLAYQKLLARSAPVVPPDAPAPAP
jgi:uncharacterized membrane protein